MIPARVVVAALAFVVSIACASARTQAQVPAQAGELGLPQLLELSQLADLLEAHAPVTPGKWEIVEQAHAEYAERYEQVFRRELESAGLLSDAWDPSSAGRWTGLHEGVVRKLLGLESTLFDTIRPAVDETRFGGLERARRRRACSWQQGSFRSLGVDSAYLYDLSTAVYALDACRAHRTALMPTLESYESARARELTGFLAAILKASGDFSKAYESLRGDLQGDEDLSPERRSEAWEQLQQQMARIAASVRPSFHALSTRQHRTLESLESQLPLDVRRLLVDRFLSEAYSIGDQESQGVPALVRRALRLRSLTDLERNEVERIDVSWWSADRATCEELMALEDERSSHWMYFDDEVWNEIARRQNDVQERRTKRTEQAKAELASLLGDERAGLLTGAEDPALFVEGPVAGGAASGAAIADANPADGVFSAWNMTSKDAVVPPSVELKSFLARRVASDPSGAVVLDVLWGDLLAAWESEVGTPWKEALDLAETGVLWGPEGPVVTQSAPEAAGARIESAAQRERELLAAFIEELRATVPTLSEDAAVLAMAWVDLEQARATTAMIPRGEMTPSTINAVRIAESASAWLAPAAVDGVLRPGCVGVVDSAETVRRRAQEHWRLGRRVEVESTLASQAGVWGSPEISALHEQHARTALVLVEAVATLATRSKEALAAVRVQLDAAGQAALDRASLRDADATAVRSMPSAVAIIESALEAMAPEDQNRATLEAAVTEFQPEHERLMDAVLDARARFPHARWDLATEFTNEDMVTLQRQSERRRTELAQATDALRRHSQRVMWRLESILGQDAARKLPGYARMKRVYVDDGGLGWVAW